MILNAGFSFKLYKEGKSIRLYLNHKEFGSRIKIRLGRGEVKDYELIRSEIQLATSKEYEGKQILQDQVEYFVNQFIDERYKKISSIFNYKTDFLQLKRETVNKKLKEKLKKSTIQKYEFDLNQFQEYFRKNKFSVNPNCVDKQILDNFFLYCLDKSAHNTAVKKHNRIKEFIKFLFKKGLGINPNFEDSKFNSEYDHLETEDDDRALTPSEVKQLIDLKRIIDNDQYQWEQPKYKKSKTFGLVKKAFEQKKSSIKLTLDFFLFCIATGQYYKDVENMALTFLRGRNGVVTCKYRRKKNNALASGILVKSTDYFILPELIKEYKIPNGKNFPITLSAAKVYKWLKEISIMAGFDYQIQPKFGRKTFASILYYTYNIPLNKVSKMLGHSSERSTMHYLRINEDDFSDELDRLIV